MALLFIAVAVATHGIVAADASGSASSSSELLGPFPDDLNWTNASGVLQVKSTWYGRALLLTRGVWPQFRVSFDLGLR